MTNDLYILTDSHAQLALIVPDALASGLVEVVPARITVGEKTFTETASLDPDDVFRAMAAYNAPAIVHAPTTADWAAAFARAGQRARHILSVHASRDLSQSWQNAKDAAATLLGRAEYVVVDSRTFGAAQSYIVNDAVRGALGGAAGAADGPANEASPLLDETAGTGFSRLPGTLFSRVPGTVFSRAVHGVRHALDRTYSIYTVENIEYLLHHRLMSPSHAVLGGLMGVKPIFTIEHGRLSAMEKVRTRAQAIERLVEFAVEFTHIEHLTLLHARPASGEGFRTLAERISEAFPGRTFSHMQYGASLAGLLGGDGIGITLMDSGLSTFESDDEDDDRDRF